MSQWQEKFAGQYKRYVSSLLQPVGPGGMSPLDTEFNRLQQVDYELMDQEGVFTTGAEPANADKNRNDQVLPNEETKITLSHIGPYDNTYINANYIDGQSLFEIPFNYIATQAPMDNTIGDFWRMIAEFQVSYIIMLTTEKNSAIYWPSRPESIMNPVRSYSVRLVKATQTDDVITRHLVLTNLDNGMTREITMFQYIAWPDEGVPRDTLGLMSIILTLGKLPNSTLHPLLVHCGAGVGRTGVFIAMHACLALFALQKKMEVEKIVQLLKYQRSGMVKTKVQYQYLVCALNREFQRMVVKHKKSVESSHRVSPTLAPLQAVPQSMIGPDGKVVGYPTGQPTIRPPSPLQSLPATSAFQNQAPPSTQQGSGQYAPLSMQQPVYGEAQNEYIGVNPWPSDAIDPITQPNTRVTIGLDPNSYRNAQPLSQNIYTPHAVSAPPVSAPAPAPVSGVGGIPVYPSYPSEVPNPPPVPRVPSPHNDLKNVYGVFPAGREEGDERVIMAAGAPPPRPIGVNGFEKRLHDVVYGSGAVGTLTAPGTPRRPRQDELSILGTSKSPIKRYLPAGNPGFSTTRASPPPPGNPTPGGALSGMSATGAPPQPSFVNPVDHSKSNGQRQNVLNILQRLTEHTQKHRSQPGVQPKTSSVAHGLRSASVSPTRPVGGRISPVPSDRNDNDYGYGLGGRLKERQAEAPSLGGAGGYGLYLGGDPVAPAPAHDSPKEGVGKYATEFEKSLFNT
eukprot:TRINITY_DN10447_c2_g1_i1.p1 TRINITY_DN10447_c2_g1~~TRINITY_DN10447_c2_g1_i1.p1  ORF type:complete len:734 (+),score=129.83 TRINITY_DN10447_c2_g1_i1:85-2286(+)